MSLHNLVLPESQNVAKKTELRPVAVLRDVSADKMVAHDTVDPALPVQIRNDYAAIADARDKVIKRPANSTAESTRMLFFDFKKAVFSHIWTVSLDMYIPVRARLKAEAGTRINRFEVFERKTLKNNELIGIFLAKYAAPDAIFDDELNADINRVYRLISERFNQERTYLFPLYLSLG